MAGAGGDVAQRHHYALLAALGGLPVGATDASITDKAARRDSLDAELARAARQRSTLARRDVAIVDSPSQRPASVGYAVVPSASVDRAVALAQQSGLAPLPDPITRSNRAVQYAAAVASESKGWLTADAVSAAHDLPRLREALAETTAELQCVKSELAWRTSENLRLKHLLRVQSEHLRDAQERPSTTLAVVGEGELTGVYQEHRQLVRAAGAELAASSLPLSPLHFPPAAPAAPPRAYHHSRSNDLTAAASYLAPPLAPNPHLLPPPRAAGFLDSNASGAGKSGAFDSIMHQLQVMAQRSALAEDSLTR